MESESVNKTESDKEEGELSNDEDNIEETALENVPVASVSRETAGKANNFSFDGNGNSKRGTSGLRLKTIKHISEGGVRQGFISAQYNQRKRHSRQRTPVSIRRKYSKLMAKQHSRSSSLLRTKEKQSVKKTYQSAKSGFGSSVDSYDELTMLVMEEKRIREQLKNLEDEEQSHGCDENQQTVCDSLLDVVEALQSDNLESDIQRVPLTTLSHSNTAYNNKSQDFDKVKKLQVKPSEKCVDILSSEAQPAHLTPEVPATPFQDCYQKLEQLKMLTVSDPKLALEKLKKYSKEWHGKGRELVDEILNNFENIDHKEAVQSRPHELSVSRDIPNVSSSPILKPHHLSPSASQGCSTSAPKQTAHEQDVSMVRPDMSLRNGKAGNKIDTGAMNTFDVAQGSCPRTNAYCYKPEVRYPELKIASVSPSFPGSMSRADVSAHSESLLGDIIGRQLHNIRCRETIHHNSPSGMMHKSIALSMAEPHIRSNSSGLEHKRPVISYQNGFEDLGENINYENTHKPHEKERAFFYCNSSQMLLKNDFGKASPIYQERKVSQRDKMTISVVSSNGSPKDERRILLAEPNRNIARSYYSHQHQPGSLLTKNKSTSSQIILKRHDTHSANRPNIMLTQEIRRRLSYKHQPGSLHTKNESVSSQRHLKRHDIHSVNRSNIMLTLETRKRSSDVTSHPAAKKISMLSPKFSTSEKTVKAISLDQNSNFLSPASLPVSKNDHLVSTASLQVDRNDHLVSPAFLPVDRNDHFVSPAFLPVHKHDHLVSHASLPVDKNNHLVSPASLQVDKNNHLVSPAFLLVETNDHLVSPAFLPVETNDHLVSPDSDSEEDATTLRQRLLKEVEGKRKASVENSRESVPSNMTLQQDIIESLAASVSPDIKNEFSECHRQSIEVSSTIVQDIQEESTVDVVSCQTVNKMEEDFKHPESVAQLCERRSSQTEVDIQSESQDPNKQLEQNPVNSAVPSTSEINWHSQEGDASLLELGSGLCPEMSKLRDNTESVIDHSENKDIGYVEDNQSTVADEQNTIATKTCSDIESKPNVIAPVSPIESFQFVDSEEPLPTHFSIETSLVKSYVSMKTGYNSSFHATSCSSSSQSKTKNQALIVPGSVPVKNAASPDELSHCNLLSVVPKYPSSEISPILPSKPNILQRLGPPVATSSPSSKTSAYKRFPAGKSQTWSESAGINDVSDSSDNFSQSAYRPSFSWKSNQLQTSVDGKNVKNYNSPVHPQIVITVDESSDSEDGNDERRIEVLQPVDSQRSKCIRGKQGEKTFQNRVLTQVKNRETASTRLVGQPTDLRELQLSIEVDEKTTKSLKKELESFDRKLLTDRKKLRNLHRRIAKLFRNVKTLNNQVTFNKAQKQHTEEKIELLTSKIKSNKMVLAKKTESFNSAERTSRSTAYVTKIVQPFDTAQTQKLATSDAEILTTAQKKELEKKELLKKEKEIGEQIKKLKEKLAKRRAQTLYKFTKHNDCKKIDSSTCSDTIVTQEQKSSEMNPREISTDLSSDHVISSVVSNSGEASVNMLQNFDTNNSILPDSEGQK